MKMEFDESIEIKKRTETKTNTKKYCLPKIKKMC